MSQVHRQIDALREEIRDIGEQYAQELKEQGISMDDALSAVTIGDDVDPLDYECDLPGWRAVYEAILDRVNRIVVLHRQLRHESN